MIQNDRASRLFHWWADHPGLQTLVVVLITVSAVIGYLDASLVTRWFSRLTGPPSTSQAAPAATSPAARSLPPVEAFQIGGGQCVLVAESENFFTAAGVTALRRVVRRLEQLPQVAGVRWLDSVPTMNLFGLAQPLLPRSTASPRQFEQARQRILQHPLAVGQFISADGQTMLFHVDVDWFYATSDEAVTTQLREAAAAAAESVPGAEMRFRVTGVVPLHIMMAQNHVRDSFRYQVIGYCIMMLFALILFRGFSAVVLVAIAPCLGVFWTLGWLNFFDLQDNPFNDIIVPVLISLVGLTDSVHLMVEVRNQRAGGLDAAAASRAGLARVGLACVLTSLTTAVGFVSLSFAHHEVVREFGWCCVLGVAMTLVSVLTVIPLGCRSPLGRRLHVGLERSPISRQLRRIGPLVDWVVRHNRAVSRFAVVATLGLVLTCLRLEPDERLYSGLSESGEAAQALRHLDESLGGLEFGYVSLTWSPDASRAEMLQVLNETGELLRSEPLLGRPLGVHDLVQALPGEGPPEERATLLELLPPPLKRAFYTPEYRSATVQFRIQDIGIAAYGPVFERIERGLEAIHRRHPMFQLALDGGAIWRWRNVYRVVVDLGASLGTASLVIWLILTMVYRSIRIGLISLVPNIFPLAATGAVLVLLGQHLEIVTVCVFTICIGIAVDDTIHFLTRYRQERAQSGTLTDAAHHAAILRAFTGVGSALLMTTIVLVAGMGTAILGDARDARLFGIMGCLTISAALFADLLLLPALLARYGLKDAADEFPVLSSASARNEA